MLVIGRVIFVGVSLAAFLVTLEKVHRPRRYFLPTTSERAVPQNISNHPSSGDPFGTSCCLGVTSGRMDLIWVVFFVGKMLVQYP